ncbi:MAG: dTDP-D-glucose 4,6-dehydratase [Candidatus Roizmanbacteria bacterium GW2011_GWC2_37_13]|uniref:dTDP-D-glucose 4,6-dehydratase n=1 Tax=Candidatus Roizmanbacteria bacterium GW2011_GWC2_37_13 TaxID=1618486 RepID=A0A0G0GGQ9_9BACT|nr:MAG: dTDP-D-glucose 4,6-dehydratase [Candidatus Roizmanbacteria bacterium GW2011_GWC1_37_12]KKQ25245.1 MAG: dTDP-D-glucose 4,6-dehydratase [Candidatus Roizmanbacteria bacterium GW2011_GWC2_37_13]
MRILITGGIGFIGTNACLLFSKNPGNKITVIDNFSRTGVEKNAQYLKDNFPKIKIIKSPVGAINNYKKELTKSDVIIHLAGQTAVTSSIKNPHHDFKNNIFESFILLDSLRRNNPKAIIIYSSTNKVYGDLRHRHRFQPIDESERLDFISPYGCSKGATDLYFLDYARIYGLKTVVFRQSCIYGPHQIGVEDQGWVAHFTKQFLLKKSIKIFGDGEQIRDLLYIEDLIKAYQLTINKISKARGEAFNIGGGTKNAYSLLQVIEILEKKFNHKIKISYEKMRVGDQKYFVSKNEKIKKLLGWRPKTDFKEGLEKLIDWQHNNITI